MSTYDDKVIRQVAGERNRYKRIIDDACAVIKAPDTTNDGGPTDLAEDMRVLLHNTNAAHEEARKYREALEWCISDGVCLCVETARIALGRDDCEKCNGEKGGVRGNENVIDGKVLCDYCTVEERGKAC